MRINYNIMIHPAPIRCSIDELPCFLLPDPCIINSLGPVPPLSAPLSRSVTPTTPKSPPPGACHFLLCSLPDQYTKAAAAAGGEASLLAPVSTRAPALLLLFTSPGPTWSQPPGKRVLTPRFQLKLEKGSELLSAFLRSPVLFHKLSIPQPLWFPKDGAGGRKRMWRNVCVLSEFLPCAKDYVKVGFSQYYSLAAIPDA